VVGNVSCIPKSASVLPLGSTQGSFMRPPVEDYLVHKISGACESINKTSRGCARTWFDAEMHAMKPVVGSCDLMEK
jgi:hypothetical protein